MKKINLLSLLYVFCLLTACSENALDSLSGKYAMDSYTFNKIENQTTDKLKKGVKAINMTLTDASGNSLNLRLGSDEWVLPTGTYVIANTVSAGKQYSATLNGNKNIAAGDVDIALIDGQYLINGLLTTSTGERFRFDYRGKITFTIGVDDPQASGYTVIMTTSAVSVTDWTTGKSTNYPELTKYSFIVSDPNGQEIALFDAINKTGAKVSEVVGTYTIQGSPATTWLMDNGWVLSQYNMAGGTYYTDADKVKQYITGGKITISAVEGIEGDMLYSFSGNVTTTTNKNVQGTGSFNYKYATLLISSGSELKDQTIKSTVLGKDMKYSVYLPASYDGTKTYPVLYLLHGADGGNNDWLTGGQVKIQASSAAAAGTAPEMIVVMPDGMNSFYCDGYNGGDIKYKTYFFDEFLPYIEKTYKIKSERNSRAIGGLSMGGFGSLYYGLLHPEMFCYVYAVSPATYIDGAPNLYDMLKQADVSKLPGITIEIGTEDFLYASAGYFKQALDGYKISNEYITRSGTHDWVFWKVCTPKIIKKMGETFK